MPIELGVHVVDVGLQHGYGRAGRGGGAERLAQPQAQGVRPGQIAAAGAVAHAPHAHGRLLELGQRRQDGGAGRRHQLDAGRAGPGGRIGLGQ